MSRGPGIRQRLIEAAFAADFDDIYMVEELAAIAFPGVNRIEKKHRVATIRAAAGACARTSFAWLRSEAPGHQNVYFNRRNLRSYAIARVRAGGYNHLSLDTIRERLDWPLDDPRRDRLGGGGHLYNARKLMEPGEAWHSHVEQWKAELDATTAEEVEAAAEKRRRMQADQARLVGALLRSFG